MIRQSFTNYLLRLMFSSPSREFGYAKWQHWLNVRYQPRAQYSSTASLSIR